MIFDSNTVKINLQILEGTFFVAEIESWRIVRTELNDNCSLHSEIVFGEENSVQTVHFVKLGELYGLKW
jgi:hypothetical protein